MREAVAVFFTLQTQWTWVGAGMAGAFKVGLDYSRIEAVARMLKIPEVTPEIFDDIRVMETEALLTWSKKTAFKG